MLCTVVGCQKPVGSLEWRIRACGLDRWRAKRRRALIHDWRDRLCGSTKEAIMIVDLVQDPADAGVTVLV